MSPTEFDIIDELYFVTGFADLVKLVQLPVGKVENSLKELLEKGFVKCFYPDPDSEISPAAPDFEAVFKNCFFLATKAGLLAHNSK